MALAYFSFLGGLYEENESNALALIIIRRDGEKIWPKI
jgi:hypothetical protein